MGQKYSRWDILWPWAKANPFPHQGRMRLLLLSNTRLSFMLCVALGILSDATGALVVGLLYTGLNVKAVRTWQTASS